MEYVSAFLTIMVIHALAVASPGPDFAMMLKNSLAYSRRTAVWTAIGIGAGIGVHVAYSLLGVGLIISQSVLIFSILKYIGAAYLIYVGIQALRAQPAEKEGLKFRLPQKDLTVKKAFASGFMCNALNPKATLFFLSLFTVVIDPATPLIVQLGYGLYMIAATAVWFSFLAFCLSSRRFKQRLIAIQHHIVRLMGGALILLGVKLATSELD